MRLKIFLLLIIMGGAIVVIRNHFLRNPKYFFAATKNYLLAEQGDDQFVFFSGRILKDEAAIRALPEYKTIKVRGNSRELTFEARLNRTKGNVFFLVNLKGYYWLDEKAALSSEATLTDFKNALAFLDWKALDNWRFSDSNKTCNKENIQITLSQKNHKPIDARKMFATQSDGKPLALRNIIFPGEPLLDDIVLQHPTHKSAAIVDCSACPIFPSEKEIISNQYETQELELDEKAFAGFDKTMPIKITITLP